MVFRRIIFNAIWIGAATGLLLTLIQMLLVSPIIFAAETYEFELPIENVQAVNSSHRHSGHSHHGDVTQHSSASPQSGTGHDMNAGHHDEDAWSPADGAERSFYTFVANILAAIGFSSMLLALMSQCQALGVAHLSLIKGVVWGVAGFIAFFVAPGIGLPPEIPGVEAAVLENRQNWWLLSVISAVIGLGIIAFAPIKLKLIGVVALAVPYIVGAPHVEGPAFLHPDPAVVTILNELHLKFIAASGVANLVFWLALGGISAWVVNRWIMVEKNNESIAS